MPEKFNIDKRIITLSAQILSGQLTREEAIAIIETPPYLDNKIDSDTNYILKKLDVSINEFEQIWNTPNKFYYDYPSYYPMIKKYSKIIIPIAKKLTNTTPKLFYELEARQE